MSSICHHDVDSVVRRNRNPKWFLCRLQLVTLVDVYVSSPNVMRGRVSNILFSLPQHKAPRTIRSKYLLSRISANQAGAVCALSSSKIYLGGNTTLVKSIAAIGGMEGYARLRVVIEDTSTRTDFP